MFLFLIVIKLSIELSVDLGQEDRLILDSTKVMDK